MDSLLRHLTTQDPNKLDELMQIVERMDRDSLYLSSFDFSAVPVKRATTWIFQLLPIGFKTRQGAMVDDYVDGSQPVFQAIIYDDNAQYRVADSVSETGLPVSEVLINLIKRAIASPLPPMKPELPGMLIIALKLSPYIPSLWPFLNSLPAPFEWRVETPQEAEEVADGVHKLNEKGVAGALDEAETEKRLGNDAIGRKDRDAAIQHYSEAIECLNDGRAQNPTEREEKRLKEMLSICLANRAAAWLLDGRGQNASKALEDATRATVYNANYGKAYYCQARTYQLLSQQDNAIVTLITALRKPALAADKGLNDTLIELFGGFPSKEEGLRAFCKKVYGGPQPRNPTGLKEFERRVNAQLRAVMGRKFSLSSLL